MKIEMLMQAKAKADEIQAKAMIEAIDEVKADVKAIRKDLDDDKAELAGLKNRGTGILVGVAIAAGGIGAGLGKFWQWIAGIAT